MTTTTNMTMVCQWCGYQWFPRVPEPRVCPRCHNPLGQQRKRPYQPRQRKAD